MHSSHPSSIHAFWNQYWICFSKMKIHFFILRSFRNERFNLMLFYYKFFIKNIGVIQNYDLFQTLCSVHTPSDKICTYVCTVYWYANCKAILILVNILSKRNSRIVFKDCSFLNIWFSYFLKSFIICRRRTVRNSL